MENKDIVRKIFLFYLVGLSILDVYGYVCNVYAYIRIQIIVEIKTIIEALVPVLPVRILPVLILLVRVLLVLVLLVRVILVRILLVCVLLVRVLLVRVLLVRVLLVHILLVQSSTVQSSPVLEIPYARSGTGTLHWFVVVAFPYYIFLITRNAARRSKRIVLLFDL